jgi:hypothetical protein
MRAPVVGFIIAKIEIKNEALMVQAGWVRCLDRSSPYLIEKHLIDFKLSVHTYIHD